jgi:hypothetical protein
MKMVWMALGLGTAHAAAPVAPRWPLDLPPVLTSTFAEYRPGRLHAGIDLATGGRTGAPCYAVGDGAVVRMRMSPFGYGKALYVQLDGGPLVVYAHLSRFAEPMAARARAEQQHTRRYTFDLNLTAGEIRVQRDMVVAWSGDTGIGVPHFHFELRDGDVARNPQTAGFPVRDTVPPVISEVSIVPLDAASTVDGKNASGVLRAGVPARVAGTVAFEVRASDTAAPGEYRQAPYRYELQVDGHMLYRLVQERFDYAHNHLLNVEYDAERLRQGERVQWLYLHQGNRLEGREAADGTDGRLWAGPPRPNAAVQAAPGRHRIEVQAADVAGHVARFMGLVDVVPALAIDSFAVAGASAGRVWTCAAHLTGGSGDSLRLGIEISLDRGATWKVLAMPRGTTSGEQRTWSGTVAASKEPVALRAALHGPGGTSLLRTCTTGATGEADSELAVEIETHWRAGWLDVVVTPAALLEAPPVVDAVRPDGSRMPLRVEQTATRAYRATAANADLAGPWAALELRARALDGRRSVVRVTQTAHGVRRGEAARIEDLDAALGLDLPAGVLLDDAVLRARPVTGPLALRPELHRAGPVWDLEPATAAFDAPYRLEVRTPAGTGTHVGLFATNQSGKLVFVASERDPDGRLVASARQLTRVAVLADATPPVIGDVHLTPRGSAPQQVRFVVTDAGAEMGDGGVETELDGAFAIPEWDSETGVVVLDLERKLGRGAHRLRVVATDQLGNRAERTLGFRVP